jgi:hypothetical protein
VEENELQIARNGQEPGWTEQAGGIRVKYIYELRDEVKGGKNLVDAYHFDVQ